MKNFKPNYLATGFTLIELVIVIVILAIIAVVAAPKFLNFSQDAKSSVLHRISGDIRSLNEMVHAKMVIEGKDKTAGNAYFDSNLGELNTYNGYLETIGEGASRIGIFEMVGVDTIEDFKLSGEVGGCAYRRGGFGDLGTPASTNLGDKCFLEYREACSLTTKYTITIVDEGC